MWVNYMLIKKTPDSLEKLILRKKLKSSSKQAISSPVEDIYKNNGLLITMLWDLWLNIISVALHL